MGPVSARAWQVGRRILHGQKGQAITEMVLVLPLLLFFIVSIVEVGSAFRTYQILTNGAREGARSGVLPNATANTVATRIQAYLDSSGLDAAQATVTQACDGPQGQCSPGNRLEVALSYPFQFRAMGPVISLLPGGNAAGWGTVDLRTRAVMRIE
jgi:Flp pilus assembly protein TadG